MALPDPDTVAKAVYAHVKNSSGYRVYVSEDDLRKLSGRKTLRTPFVVTVFDKLRGLGCKVKDLNRSCVITIPRSKLTVIDGVDEPADPTSAQPSESLTTLTSLFIRHNMMLRSPEGSSGICEYAVRHFHKFLVAVRESVPGVKNIRYKELHLLGSKVAFPEAFGSKRVSPDPALYHVVSWCDGWVFDVTRAQFDPTCTQPYVVPAEEYLAQWNHVFDTWEDCKEHIEAPARYARLRKEKAQRIAKLASKKAGIILFEIYREVERNGWPGGCGIEPYITSKEKIPRYNRLVSIYYRLRPLTDLKHDMRQL